MVVSSGLRSLLRRAMRNETHDYQHPIHWFRTLGSSPSSPFSTWRNNNNNRKNNKARMDDKKSDWWIVDGEMHEIGENVPPRERFVIPRDNLPNKRRKQMREQFMRRTRLVLKESEHEPFCKRYIELYQELRENWERLYWDEGYSKKLAQDHANYESAEDDDLDFSPYRKRRAQPEQPKDQGFRGSRVDDTREKVGQIRDKFEFDRERRMREKAFAPMHRGTGYNFCNSGAKNQSFDTAKYFPQFEMN